jgi:hypothetical protein
LPPGCADEGAGPSELCYPSDRHRKLVRARASQSVDVCANELEFRAEAADDCRARPQLRFATRDRALELLNAGGQFGCRRLIG